MAVSKQIVSYMNLMLLSNLLRANQQSDLRAFQDGYGVLSGKQIGLDLYQHFVRPIVEMLAQMFSRPPA